MAFAIPKEREGRRLELRTWHKGNSIRDEQIFCPVITALDARKHPIGRVDLPAMEFTRAGLIDNARFSTVVDLPSGAEYIVVHTPAESIGSSLSTSVNRQSSVIVIGTNVYVQPGGAKTLSIRCGQQGRLSFLWL